MEKSIAYFEEAIKKDPAFAPAYIGLAQAYETLGKPGTGGAPPSEVLPKVIRAARKALDLDPALPGAHALMGDLYQIQWQWSDAEREYKLAPRICELAAVSGTHGGGAGMVPACPGT